MPTIARFMALVHPSLFPLCRLTFLLASTRFPAWCVRIGSRSMPTKLRWCGLCWRAGSRSFLAVPSRSLLLPLNQSSPFVTWVSLSTVTLVPPPMFKEPLHVALLPYHNFATNVDMSSVTASVFLCRPSCILGWTATTSYLSVFLLSSTTPPSCS